ncbi:fumarylacetoacetate hydrolase family protein [Paenibacillus sp. GCM10012307]|uniref:Fumarylacetoacetate hydrolase family protein n=1 Tax=Paenibacillus roseus TaxID=2798579 RepID=A0A934J801_9BACL|nr:fumarylacetoacetate hydrolase family protein [Paenibacillus roseus]MBJ6362406.1 fumarylacetoacetate hydrolase family protein [Paenibacillus roseus]
MSTIKNVYAVGRNYALHAAELGNATPETPMIFMKPSHAAVLLDGREIRLPDQFGAVHYETELVIRMAREYEPGAKAEELIGDFALGLDLTLRDVQTELKAKQLPWLKAKGFKSSAPITAFRRFEGLSQLAAASFSLNINGEERQRGHIQDMIFDLQTLIDHIGGHYGLGEGDVIFTGTPAGVGEIKKYDEMELFWGDELLGSCRFIF